jgi:adenylate kinase
LSSASKSTRFTAPESGSSGRSVLDRPMRVALTGVPGTGKSTVAAALAERHGWHVVGLNGFARDHGLLGQADAARGSLVIDMDDLAEALNREYATALPALLMEGHFAHEMDADLVVLLRCDPALLVERLRARGWSEEKVRENVEAEALDVLAQEVLDAAGDADADAYELDVTGMGVEEAADQVYAIAEGRPQALKGRNVGRTTWPLESLPWF